MGTLGYAYDAVGNRTNRSITGTVGLGNQTPTYNTNDWINGDIYDSNGNTRTNASSQPYFYDALNELTNFNNGTVIIGYDGDGNRVSKKVGAGTTTYYLVDDQNPTGYAQVMEEYQGSLTAVYTYGLDLVSQRRSGTVSYYVYDGHGSVRALTGTSGTVTDTYQYDAYGTKLSTSMGPTANNYLYTGEQFDADLGFYYLRARYYKPDTGRFWSMDTYQGDQSDALSLHKYLFGEDNPVSATDPSGHDDLTLPSVTFAGSFIAGGVAEVGEAVTARAFSWATFRVITAATAIGVETGGDKGGKVLLFHYSQDPPTSFEQGLFPPAWVTPVGGLDANSAMFKLGISRPRYEYTFRLNYYILGPANNSTPGRIVQFEVLMPTGAGSLVIWKPLF